MSDKQTKPSGARRAGETVRRRSENAGSFAGQVAARNARSNISRTFPALAPIVMAVGTPGGRALTREFVGGLSGAPDQAAVVAASKAQAADKALQKGRTAKAPTAAPKAEKPRELTPQERQLAALDSILRQPFTMEELLGVSQAMPGTKSPSAKDMVFGSTAALSQDIFQSQIAGIMAQKEAGEIDLKTAQDLTAKATDAHFQRQAGLVGFNPLQMAQAQMLYGAQQEGE